MSRLTAMSVRPISRSASAVWGSSSAIHLVTSTAALRWLSEEDDDLLTIELHTGQLDRVITLDEDQRFTVAAEGWSAFVNFEVPLYRDENRQHHH